VPPFWTPERVSLLLLAAYGVGAGLLLLRWLLAHALLARLLRQARLAPEAAIRLLAGLGPGPPPRLLVSPRTAVPFSHGLRRPTIVLPAGLCERASPLVLRWVLAHERAHLERRDGRACLLLGLAQVLFYPLPWFWRLARQVRLCQEYVADAIAAAGGHPADYAEFLLAWAAAPPPPALGSGVGGRVSDLTRRIVMLLQTPVAVERRCPRRWSLLAATVVLALGVTAAGVGLDARAAPVPQKKDEPGKDEPKKEEPKKDGPKKEEPKKDEPRPERPPLTLQEVHEQFAQDLRQAQEALQKAIRDAQQQFQQNMDPEALQKSIRNAQAEFQKAQRQAQEEFQRAMELAQRPGLAPARPRPAFRGAEARLGVRLEPIGATLAEQLGLPPGQGLVLEEVLAGSPAARAGLRSHDVLIEWDGKPVSDKPEEFARQLSAIQGEVKVDVVVLRKGQRQAVKGLNLPARGAGFVQPAQRFLLNISAQRNGDRLTTRLHEGSLMITVAGRVEGEQFKLDDIAVQDAGPMMRYDSLDKVPEKYRDRARLAVEVSQKSVGQAAPKP
jgi:hypothetical protein